MGGKNSKTRRPPAIDYRATPTLELMPSVDNNILMLSKEELDFQSEMTRIEIGEAVWDQLDIMNNTDRKIKFKFVDPGVKSCEMKFVPERGSLAKGKQKNIRAKLLLNQPGNMNFRITLLGGGERHFINVKVRASVGVFGADPSTLEMTDDNGFRVPTLLVTLKKIILTSGLESEGIFRVAGDAAEINELKERFNKNAFDGAYRDVNTVASLLKIWFRELPSPVLNAIPKASIFNATDQDNCIQAYQGLPEMERTLLDWLIDLLMTVAAKSHINKMTIQNLAIVVAPNLYNPPGSDPIEGLVLSQKCVQFLHNILLYKTGI